MVQKFYKVLFFLLITSSCFAQQNSKQSASLQNEVNRFLENRGQIKDGDGNLANQVKFALPLGDNSIFLLEDGIAYQFKKINYPENFSRLTKFMKTREKIAYEEKLKSIKVETFRIDFEFIDCNNEVQIVTEGKSHDYINYYNHNTLNVYGYSKVIYKNIYDGIDWVLTTIDEGIKYDFIVHPGANPSAIKLKYKYHNDIQISKKQELIFGGLLGDIIDEKPISFQGDREIPTSYKLEDNVVSYKIGNYDKTKTLVIDPLSRIWGTYYGGTGTDIGNDCNVDGLGNSYLAGSTSSSSAMASGGYDVSYGGNDDAFLVKFNPAGVRQWATYYGNGGSNYGNSTVADGSNNVYLAGSTTSGSGLSYFGHQGYGGGAHDAFLVKFNAAGTRIWSTMYGGSLSDWGNGVDVDASNNVYMAGNTRSTNNIYDSPGYQSTANGGVDAYLVKFNSSGVRQFGTYYGIDIDDGGGGEWTEGWDCAVSSNSVFLVGFVEYNLDGEHAAYIARYSLAGTSALSYNILHGYNSNPNIGTGTWDGTGNQTFAYSCAVDASGNAYMGGTATSANSNSTFSNVSAPYAHQSSAGSGIDGIMVKFTASLTPLWKSFYGGSGHDFAYTVYHQGGDIYLGGRTASTNNIANNGYQNTKSTGVDAFLAKFNTSGVRDWGTYYGGNGTDIGNGCAVDDLGNQFLCGVTSSTNNIASGGHQNSKSTGNDGFLVKFSECVAVNNTTSSAPICENQIKTLTASGSGGTWTILSGGGMILGNTYSPPNISVNTTVTIQYTDDCGNQSNVSFIVYPIPTSGISRNNPWICSGGNSTFSAFIGAGSTFSRFEYRWDNSGTWNAWGTTNPYTWSPGNPTFNGRYLYVRVRTTTVGGCVGYSPSTWVRLYYDPSTPAIARSPTAATVCVGQAIDIPVFSQGSNGIASNGSNCITQYRYAQGGGGYTGWVTSSNPPAITATSPGTFYYQYRRYCTGSGCSDPVATQSWTVVADPTVSISGGGTICVGGNRTLGATAFGGTGTCTFQWQVSTNNITWNNISGAISSVYNTGTLSSTRYYRVQRNCNGGGCSDPFSNVQVVTVVADPTISISGGGTICIGGNRTLGASALGGTGTCTYQWQISTNNIVWNNIASANSSVYNTGVLTSTRYYRVVRNCNGSGCSDPTSNVQTVTVVADPVVSISGGGTICTGGSTWLGATYSGGTGTCTFQWQVSLNNSSWSNISGANSSIYNTGSLTATRYYRVLRNCNGSDCSDPISNVQTITVEPTHKPASFTTAMPTAVCEGEAVELQTDAEPAPGYQIEWYTGPNGTGTLVGTGSSIEVFPTAAGTYYAFISGSPCPDIQSSVYVNVIGIQNVVLPTLGLHEHLLEQCEIDGWTYYSNFIHQDEYIFAIRKNGQSVRPTFDINLNSHFDVISSVQPVLPSHGSYLMRRYWNVELTSGSIANGIDIRFYYDPADLDEAMALRDNEYVIYNGSSLGPHPQWFKTNAEDGGFAPSLLTPGMGNNWTFPFTPLAGIDGEENGVTYVQFDGLTSLSGGTGGTSFGQNNPLLPVELVSFTARPNQQSITLDWVTASEINNDRFDILRSENAISFNKVGEVQGNGTTNEVQNYTFTDTDVNTNTTYYYKLKQIDFDGRHDYSGIVNARMTSDAKFAISDFMPNPAQSISYLEIVSQEDKYVEYFIANIVGQEVAKGNINIVNGTQRIAFDIHDIIPGNYILTLVNSDGEKFPKKLQIIR